MTGRRLRQDRGVATVIGAILLTGILLGSLVIVRLTFVPVWQEDAEARHASVVTTQVSSLKSEVDKALHNRSAATVTTPITLGKGGSNLLTPDVGGSSIAFAPSDAPTRLWSHRLQLIQLNETIVYGSEESWSGVAGATSLTEIGKVLNFRLRVHEIGKSHNGHSITVTLTDGLGAYAGEFEVHQESNPPDSDIYYTVRNAAGEEIFDNAYAIHNANDYGPYWVDLLDSEFRFDRVLSEAEPPISITLTENQFTGDFTITYQEAGPDGRIVGNSGSFVTDWKRKFDGGTFSYTSENAYFVRQDLVIDNGALVLDQSDGAIFKVPPAFDVAFLGTRVNLDFTLPVLEGDTTTLSSQGTAVVRTTAKQPTFLGASTSNLTIEISSRYPQLWADHLRGELLAAFLTEGDHFDLAVSGDRVRLELWGPITDPTSTSLDINFRFTQANVLMEVLG